MRIHSSIFLILYTTIAHAQITDEATVSWDFDKNGSEIFISDPNSNNWTLESSTDLSIWDDEGSFRVSNGGYQLNVSDISGALSKFYRIKVDDTVLSSSFSVSDSTILPTVDDNFSLLSLPSHLITPQINQQDNTPNDNPVTDSGATLGRVLFYDKRLSQNFSVSCASCHEQEFGFSDPNQFSTGFNGETTSRNSMGLTSAKYYTRGAFFWDERASTLEDQVLEPIQNAVEMGLSLSELVDRISAEGYYGELFVNAFGDSVVTTERIADALSQFIRSIASSESKYDTGVTSSFSNFSAQELLGMQLFNGEVAIAGGTINCASCHETDNFVPTNNINNIGLENPYIDKGLGEVTGLSQDEGKFKVGSLRNVALTAPYMHDGRFSSLKEVVDFYNDDIVNHPNLSGPLRTGGPNGGAKRGNWSGEQVDAIVAFLNTLTDTSVITDQKFSDPFKYQSDLIIRD